MDISIKAAKEILNIGEKVKTKPEAMAKNLIMTFFPYTPKNLSEEIKKFSSMLKSNMEELGVKFLPYEECLVKTPLRKIIKQYFFAIINDVTKKTDTKGLKILSQIKHGKKIKNGVSVIMLGEAETGNLPMDYISNFRNSNIITIVDKPDEINEYVNFYTHFETAMKLFAHHMTNIIIAVDKEKWIVYNFNASHPVYSINDKNFKNYLLTSLIPKIAAPIRPNKLSEFKIKQQTFNPKDQYHKPFVDDLIESGELLEKTGLYPPGKKIDELPFRNEFYKWVGKIHLDNRNGMSYGFLAHQMPTKLSNLLTFEEAKIKYKNKISEQKDYFVVNKTIFLILKIETKKYVLAIPEVYTLTLKSGANKTNPSPQTDLVKLGLKNGKMILETPKGLKIKSDYKPSFDTKVILAHAVGNAIIGSVLKHFLPTNNFSKQLEKSGMAMAHWHGYINKKFVPKGWYVYGQQNPHVACSTPQSAIFALLGKIKTFSNSNCLKEKKDYCGDIHIEPQHGTNITFPSLKELAIYLNQNKNIATLGNLYLPHYK